MMNKNERGYLDMLSLIMAKGVDKNDRTGTGTRSIFGHQLHFDLQQGFPLLTTKRVPFRILAEEMLWFLSGDTYIKPLIEKNIHIWSDWAFQRYATSQKLSLQDENGRWRTESDEYKAALGKFEQQILENERFEEDWGYLGPIYGAQWREWGESYIDQVARLIETLQTDPDSRRMIVTAWNPSELYNMFLPPCHMIWQVWTREITWNERMELVKDPAYGIGKRGMNGANMDDMGIPRRALKLHLYQRSWDTFLGAPFNIAQYALLTHMIAQQVNMVPEELIISAGDAHIYHNHFDAINEQLSRPVTTAPKLIIKRKPESIFDYTIEDFEIAGYNPQPAIKAPVAV